MKRFRRRVKNLPPNGFRQAKKLLDFIDKRQPNLNVSRKKGDSAGTNAHDVHAKTTIQTVGVGSQSRRFKIANANYMVR